MFKIPEYGDIIVSTVPIQLNVIKSARGNCEDRLQDLFKLQNGIDFDAQIPESMCKKKHYFYVEIPVGIRFSFLSERRSSVNRLYRLEATKKENSESTWGFFTSKLPNTGFPLNIELSAKEFNQCNFVLAPDK